MHIESETPIGVGPPEVWVDAYSTDSRQTAALDYETWTRDPVTRVVRIKCYDGAGQSISISLSEGLLQEILLETVWAP